MAYVKTIWTNGATALSAENMNHIEEGIAALDTGKVDKVSGKGLSTNDYTTTEKTKLTGIATGAEVNQNAFSNVKVGSTTVAADSKTDTLELVAGSNVTLTPDATNDKVTIASTDTWRGIQNNLTSTSTTDSLSAYQGKVLNDGKAAKSEAIKNITRSGTTFTATKADGTTFTFTQQDNDRTYTAVTGKPTANAAPGFGGTVTVSQVAQNTNGQVSVTDRTITIPSDTASSSAPGLMSASDKTKLDSMGYIFSSCSGSGSASVAANSFTSYSYPINTAIKKAGYQIAVSSIMLYDSNDDLSNCIVGGFGVTYENNAPKCVVVRVYNPTSSAKNVNWENSVVNIIGFKPY